MDGAAVVVAEVEAGAGADALGGNTNICAPLAFELVVVDAAPAVVASCNRVRDAVGVMSREPGMTAVPVWMCALVGANSACRRAKSA